MWMVGKSLDDVVFLFIQWGSRISTVFLTDIVCVFYWQLAALSSPAFLFNLISPTTLALLSRPSQRPVNDCNTIKVNTFTVLELTSCILTFLKFLFDAISYSTIRCLLFRPRIFFKAVILYSALMTPIWSENQKLKIFLDSDYYSINN